MVAAPIAPRTFERLECWMESLGISICDISDTPSDRVMEELKGKEIIDRRSGEKRVQQ